MHQYLVDMLECPACHGSLSWDVSHQDGDRILTALAECKGCRAEYPIREGIGLFLTPDLPREDLWEQSGRNLSETLSQHPEIEAQLMEVPIFDLGPADQFIRGMALEERGEWDSAQEAFGAAMAGLYTYEYRACWQLQIEYVLKCVAGGNNPIVDLASGRCYLVRDLVEGTSRPIVATDFSPHVLRRNRRWLIHHNLYDRISLLAFDARRTPFRDNSIDTLTTNVGLPNIHDQGTLLHELRRIVSNRFLAISHYYAPDDVINLAALRTYGLERSMLLDTVLADFLEAGWKAEVRNLCKGRALPSPKGAVMASKGIDALPVAETTLDWCVIEAS